MDPDDSYTYAAARQIANLFFAYARADENDHANAWPWLDDRRGAAPNPHYYQTQQGLILNFSNGPLALWTPWGEWRFVGGITSRGDQLDNLHRVVLEQLLIYVIQPYDRTNMDNTGPIYGILNAVGQELPQPVLRKASDYLSVDEVRARWTELTRVYNARH